MYKMSPETEAKDLFIFGATLSDAVADPMLEITLKRSEAEELMEAALRAEIGSQVDSTIDRILQSTESTNPKSRREEMAKQIAKVGLDRQIVGGDILKTSPEFRKTVIDWTKNRNSETLGSMLFLTCLATAQKRAENILSNKELTLVPATGVDPREIFTPEFNCEHDIPDYLTGKLGEFSIVTRSMEIYSRLPFKGEHYSVKLMGAKPDDGNLLIDIRDINDPQDNDVESQ